MSERSVHNPHLTEPYSELQTLVMTALRRYGDGAPGAIDGELMMMFLGFANDIIEEVRAHPYWEALTQKGLAPALDYYTHPTDIRPIPDQIIVNGLIYYYALQQLSEKAGPAGPNYTRVMAQKLWQMLTGGARPQFTVVDGGSRGGRS